MYDLHLFCLIGRVCQKRFTRKENLDRHERKHNNDSFFPCSECGLLYRRKDNMYRHLKEKHQSGAGLQNRPVDINHPDQHYTITKEKEKKMPRFNIESNEYSISTLRKADVCYIQLYTMVQDELFVGL
jgi:uncharacterized C2H2 Zn-finger protein